MANILIVDDSSSMRQMVSFTLKSKGHNVTEAVDGNKALAEAQKSAFDLVITDVNMPGMDGLTLTKELRTNSLCKTVPILLLTTEASAEKKAEGRAAGATGWLVKPFHPDSLMATIAKVLR
jgi:two-component system chemotaxis response regulator CheY